MSGLARFAAVGALGFVVDSSVLYAGLAVGLTLLSGRLVSFLTAATFTWYCNRRFTFRSSGRSTGRDYAREWLRYLMANAVGGAANLGVYAALVTAVRAIAEMPVIAVAAGSATGLIFNFALSRALVFGREHDV